MLVYERKGEDDASRFGNSATSSPGEVVSSAPTGRLAEKITKMNRDYAVSCESYQLE